MKFIPISVSGCYMSVGRPGSRLWVDLLQYVGWASPIFVVDLVYAIGFQWLERIAPAIFVFKECIYHIC